MFEGMSMEMIFVVTYGGTIAITVAATLFGCWLADRFAQRDIDNPHK
jgi:hypothetical protein